MAIITIRLIKSFEYRNVKNMVLKDLDLETLTLQGLVDMVRSRLGTESGFVSWGKNACFDALKLYSQPFGAKSQHLVINLEGDDQLLLFSPLGGQENMSMTLAKLGCKHETEISMFDYAHYEKYKQNPQTLW